jgi:hypothetical protein
MKKLFLFLGVLFVFAVVSYAEDSALVKAAKAEKERRAKTEAKKTLTNQDVEEIRKKQPTTGIETAAPGDETKTTEGEAKDAGKDKDKKKEDSENGEAYWHQRKQDVDKNLEDAKSRVEQIQSEINTLTAAFYAESDGVGQRPVIEQERTERLKALEVAKQDLANAQAESDGLEDEARKAGALPGWVRD